jgi:hypothetical protein
LNVECYTQRILNDLQWARLSPDRIILPHLPPPPPPLPAASCFSFSVFSECRRWSFLTEEGGRRDGCGAKSHDCKKAWPYKNHSVLSGNTVPGTKLVTTTGSFRREDLGCLLRKLRDEDGIYLGTSLFSFSSEEVCGSGNSTVYTEDNTVKLSNRRNQKTDENLGRNYMAILIKYFLTFQIFFT